MPKLAYLDSARMGLQILDVEGNLLNALDASATTELLPGLYFSEMVWPVVAGEPYLLHFQTLSPPGAPSSPLSYTLELFNDQLPAPSRPFLCGGRVRNRSLLHRHLGHPESELD